MKKTTILYFTVIALFTLFTTSCSEEEIEAIGPTITLINAPDESVKIGESTTFSFSIAKGSIEMDRVTFRVDGDALDPERFTINGETLTASGNYSVAVSEDAGKTYVIILQAAEEATTETIQIAVIDQDNKTSAISVTVETTE